MTDIRYDRYKRTFIDLDTREIFPVIWAEQLIGKEDYSRNKIRYNFWKYCFKMKYVWLDRNNEFRPIQPIFHGVIFIPKDINAPRLDETLDYDEQSFEQDRLIEDNVSICEMMFNDCRIVTERWNIEKHGIPNGSKCSYAKTLIDNIRSDERYETVYYDMDDMVKNYYK